MAKKKKKTKAQIPLAWYALRVMCVDPCTEAVGYDVERTVIASDVQEALNIIRPYLKEDQFVGSCELLGREK